MNALGEGTGRLGCARTLLAEGTEGPGDETPYGPRDCDQCKTDKKPRNAGTHSNEREPFSILFGVIVLAQVTGGK